MPSVIALIKRRQAERSSPGSRSDDKHIALVVEGGGMRGVISGGMVTALEKCGIVNEFDSVHGSSAGAAAGAYFLGGRAAVGTSIYYEDINNSRFINIFRALIGQPIMNVDFLVDVVFRNIKPMNAAEVIVGAIPCYVVSTNAKTGHEIVESNFSCVGEFFDFLKGSVTIPLIAGSPKPFKNNLLIDGGLNQQIAVESAISSGATHILVLFTRASDELMRPEGGWKRVFEANILKMIYGKSISDLYAHRSRKINDTVKLCFSEELQSSRGVKIQPVCTSKESPKISRLEKNCELLKKGDLAGQQAIFSLFGET